MHDSFENKWGDHHGNEGMYWQRRIEVVEIFATIDTDGDGLLEADELKSLFTRLLQAPVRSFDFK